MRSPIEIQGDLCSFIGDDVVYTQDRRLVVFIYQVWLGAVSGEGRGRAEDLRVYEIFLKLSKNLVEVDFITIVMYLVFMINHCVKYQNEVLVGVVKFILDQQLFSANINYLILLLIEKLFSK